MRPTFVSEMRGQIARLMNKYFHYEEITILKVAPDILKMLSFIGTYLLCNKNKIIYIGASSDIGNRILNHLKRKTGIGKENGIPPFGHEITEIIIIPFRSWEYAEALETFLIDKFKPKYNFSNLITFSSLGRYSPISKKESIRIINRIHQIYGELQNIQLGTSPSKHKLQESRKRLQSPDIVAQDAPKALHTSIDTEGQA